MGPSEIFEKLNTRRPFCMRGGREYSNLRFPAGRYAVCVNLSILFLVETSITLVDI